VSWAAGSTREWRELRAAILARDRYRCRAHADGWCDQAPGVHTCTGAAPLDGGHAHHTRGRAVTGDDPRYIVAACSACNLHIGDPTKHETTDPRPRPRTRWED
jgi:hypothetical protein